MITEEEKLKRELAEYKFAFRVQRETISRISQLHAMMSIKELADKYGIKREEDI